MSSKKEPSADERFARVKKDPRFWEMPDVEQKVRIDKRFQSMFHDERFKLKYTVDKRGRPVNHTSTEDLKRFYKLSDSEQSDADDTHEEQKKKKVKAKEEELEKGEEPVSKKAGKKKVLKSSECEKIRKAEPVKGVRVVEEVEEEDEEELEEDEEEYSDSDKGVGLSDDGEEDDDEGESESEDDSDSGPDLARGKGNIETSSEEEDEDEVEEFLHHEEEEIEHDWGEMWKDAPRTEEVSCRLAVCNMNWDRIKAKDLLALFSSFKPKGGVVLSVTIYPSEFGKERLKVEQTQGPLELTSLPDDPDADTEEQRIYRERMRDYQFKRLRYYYAVVECDSPETATKIYEECDGFEYESSCSTLDLRFVPDNTTFEDEPKDRATDVDLATYQPKLFTSTATTTAKVELTWDETDHDRITTLSKKFNKDELLNMDFQAYLASSSEDEVEAEEVNSAECETEEKKKGKKEEEQIAKYRELLQSIQNKDKKEKDKDMEMEITWVPGLKESAEKLVKKKMEGKDKMTPWEEFLEKKKEKKKEKRKGKKEAEVQDEAAISDDELPPDVDLDDPFFSEELGGSTGTAQKIKKAKKNKKGEEQLTVEEEAALEKQKAEMALLMDDDEGEEHRHFNYDQIVEQQNLSKKKRKKLLKSNTLLEEDNFKVDLQDSRFQAMFTSHLYNLDPSDPAYKKTKGTQSILEEKQRRRAEQQRSQEEALQSQEKPSMKTEEKESRGGGEMAGSTSSAAPSKILDPSLSLLIKSVKNKTAQFHARKKQRTK
ncbi:ESF1 homolog [Neoarius graeffei]|uniref:ESF1 homolog n=1 Tax=Neoarius graeffei TaxID=443677 RepID=UPI00298C948B|nr:ESF1 homolog [Neoarius graeffei]XP_060755081.1 ESF1 homolog [Neoarius graeffei]XP_060755082.1 ESF1 homolog [Neoarius graeffei]XP_060755083.1 ESF1 homolog [Neoarius graeffei]XP_060755084.1 ESF1 homolog [Neoarius graeffei]